MFISSNYFWSRWAQKDFIMNEGGGKSKDIVICKEV